MATVIWLDEAAAGLAAPSAPGASTGPLDDLHLQVGGKAAALVRLLSAGLPVPDGFVVCADALARPSRAHPDEMPPVPERVAQDVCAAYRALGQRAGEAAPLVAVRSSGTAEDLPEASFAGQYETVLGVRGADDLVAAVARCWRSLWSPRARAYREQAMQQVAGRGAGPTALADLQAPQMAVLVQMLVPATAAGVAYTADPVSGAADHVLVNGAWGLGLSVVDGEVEPDTWRVHRETAAVEAVRLAHKLTQHVPDAGAARMAVPDQLQDAPCLAQSQVAEVARVALAAEAVLEAPADIEWAAAGEQIWLLQARPITGLPASTHGAGDAAGTATGGGAPAAGGGRAASEPGQPEAVESSAPFPFQWSDPADAALHWTQRAVDGRAPEVMPPLELDVRARWARTLLNSRQITGERWCPPRTLEANGRQYWHYAGETPGTPPSEPPDDLAQQRETFRHVGELLCARGENYLDAVTFPEMREGNRRLASVDPEALAPEALAAHLEDALRWYERGWTLHWSRPEANPTRRFISLYAELTGDQDRDAARALLLHEPNKMTEAVAGLMDLARIVQQHGALYAHLAGEPPELIAADLNALERIEGGPALLSALRNFLDPERHGLRSGASWGVEQNQCLPGWRDAPHVVIALLQRYLPLELDALAQAQREVVDRRDARVAEIRRGLTDAGQRQQFDFWLAAGRQAQRAQEDHNYHIDSATNALLHRAITACGRRLAAAGVIATAEDAWWLREHQLLAAVRGLVGSRHIDWAPLVAAHKSLCAWQRTLVAPPWLGAPPTDPATPRAPAAQSERPAPPANLLVQGQPAAAGIRTGRVRLVRHDAADAHVPLIGPGDVLVARQAGALWGPIAPAAAAVVLEVGGPFMHIMAVCREYGVPGVVNAKDATRLLRDGQVVTVDGAQGWVLAAD